MCYNKNGKKGGVFMKGYEDLPAGYAPLFSIDLQKQKKLAALVYTISGVIAAALVVLGIFAVPEARLFDFSDGYGIYFLRLLVMVVGLFAYIILHELVHGVFMRLFSRQRVKYGFTVLYAYAGSDAYFDKSSYIIIALAPVIVWGAVLAVICALLPPAWFWPIYIIQISNLAGAAGDFYVTARFARLPRDILVRDTGVSMTVFAKSAETV